METLKHLAVYLDWYVIWLLLVNSLAGVRRYGATFEAGTREVKYGELEDTGDAQQTTT